MATDYSITIRIDEDTVKKLNDPAWSLQGFKAVRSARKDGMPLVWLSFSDFLAEVTISWTDTYMAYISTTEDIGDDVHVVATAHVDVELGETAEVDEHGRLQRQEGGVAGAIAIANRTSKQFTCGIGHPTGNSIAPLCAFPLRAMDSDVIAPTSKVLLMFAMKPVRTSTVIMTAHSNAVLLDLTRTHSTEVSFSLRSGWSLGGATSGEILPSGTDLVPVLISTADDLGRSR